MSEAAVQAPASGRETSNKRAKSAFAVAITLAASLSASSLSAAPQDDLRAANIAFAFSDTAGAERLFGRALASGALTTIDAERAYLKRAESFALYGDTAAALADLTQAASVDPNDPEIAALRSLIEHPVELGATLFPAPTDWIEIPSGSDFASAYPDQAQHQSIPGQTILRCVVTASGTLGGCVVLAEAPDGLGFGRAGLELSKRFKLRAATRLGAPTAGRTVVIPIGFATTPAAAQAEADARRAYQTKDYSEASCPEALTGLRKAAVLGNVMAAYEIGRLYQEGCGAPSDMAQALAWYRGAAKYASRAAWDAIGRIYAEGAGVPRDEAVARAWMTKAAAAGVLDAEAWLIAHPAS